MADVEMLEGSDAPSAQFHWNFVKNEEEWLALPGEHLLVAILTTRQSFRRH
jgi:hypothetical protein